MATKPIDLESYFPFFLGTVSNRWTATSSRLYLGRFGIGIGEWRVLASIHFLARASSNEIVALIAMDPGAVSRSVAKLHAEGLIVAAAGKFTGRTKPFVLTAKGRKLHANLQRVALRREDALLGALSAEERRTLIELMRKVLSRIDSL